MSPRLRSRAAAAVLAAVLAAAAGLGLAKAATGAPETPQQRADRISDQLLCPVCQGLSVADSPSTTARAMAGDVRRRVDAGQTDEEIRQAFVDRYGRRILLARDGAPAALATAVPVAVLIAGAGLLAYGLRRWSRAPPARPTADDAELVRTARARRGGPR